jgi:sterol desaturase/sphingolipid hydroxylase (fatty acid hydroxylase superfamily)
VANLTAHAIGIGKDLLELAAIAVWFFVLAWVVKRERALADAKAAAGQTRINFVIMAVDGLAVAPVISLAIKTVANGLQGHSLTLTPPGLWTSLGVVVTGVVAVFLGDFIGYWRHRVQHSRWLWPAHAVHHSDTHLTWFSLGRMHPVDRIGTATDVMVMAALGLPAWAVSVTVMVRHFYGYFVHADLPWTFGKLAWVMNPPVAHRWHHARDVEGSGANFATVFSVFDRAFGTWRVPGPCTVPLGVPEDMGKGAIGQYLHPFRVWRHAIAAQIRSRSQATSGSSAGGIG